ncbi:protein tyrosine phosphatase type IVA 2 isoform X2 [Melospiza melodia melodia]|uniref:protein tyrosine phosphatase type IVA 2 isoform X2 n=1 Tax=Melospiza melodia melodia TaxID=1914991 RepID=UPI002FD5D6B3
MGFLLALGSRFLAQGNTKPLPSPHQCLHAGQAALPVLCSGNLGSLKETTLPATEDLEANLLFLGTNPSKQALINPRNYSCSFLMFSAVKRFQAPVEITYENLRFLITHNPTNATLSKFIEELKKYGVTTLVRVCDATYDQAPIEKEGIQVLDWPFDDGAPASQPDNGC